MPSSIQRGGYWWNQRPDGVWLRWSAAHEAWEPQEGEPPPPGTPPPPPAPEGEPVPRTVSGAKLSSPSPQAPAPAVPAGQGDDRPAPEVGAATPAQAAEPSAGSKDSVEEPEKPAPAPSAPSAQEGPQVSRAEDVSDQASSSEPEANAEPTHAEASVEDGEAEGEGGSLAPLAPHPVAANAPVFSQSSGAPSAGLLANRKVLGVLAAVLVVLVFLGTYTGANLFFSQVYGPEVAHADEKKSSRMSQAKRRYIARLDNACRRQAGSAAKLQARLLTATSAAQMERVLTRLASLVRRSLERVTEIPRPKEDRRLLERIFKLQRSALPLLERLLIAARERNSAALDAIAAEAYASAAESAQLMQRYGFEVCGRT